MASVKQQEQGVGDDGGVSGGGGEHKDATSASEPHDVSAWFRYNSVWYPCDNERRVEMRRLLEEARTTTKSSAVEEGKEGSGQSGVNATAASPADKSADKSVDKSALFASVTASIPDSVEKGFWRRMLVNLLASGDQCFATLHRHQEVGIVRLVSLLSKQMFDDCLFLHAAPTQTQTQSQTQAQTATWESVKPQSFTARLLAHHRQMRSLAHSIKKNAMDISCHYADAPPLDVHGGALVADAAGLGKTLQVICTIIIMRKLVAALLAASERYDDVVDFLCAPVLIVAPNSLIAHWASEFVRHIHLNPNHIHIYHGTTAATRNTKLQRFLTEHSDAVRRTADSVATTTALKYATKRQTWLRTLDSSATLSVIVTTAGTLRADSKVSTRKNITTAAASSRIDDTDAAYVRRAEESKAKRAHLALFHTPMLATVFDEAHMTMGNVATAAHAAAATVVRMMTFVVTATPIVNRFHEDLAAMALLMHDFEHVFDCTWQHKRWDRAYIDKWRHTYIISRGKKHLALPPVTETIVNVDLLPAERKLYLALLDQTLYIISQSDLSINKEEKKRLYTRLLEKLMRLRQIALFPLLMCGRAAVAPLSTESHYAKRMRSSTHRRSNTNAVAANAAVQAVGDESPPPHTAAAHLEKSIRLAQAADHDDDEEEDYANYDHNTCFDDEFSAAAHRINAKYAKIGDDSGELLDTAHIARVVDGRTELAPTSKVLACMAFVDHIMEKSEKGVIMSYFAGFLDVLEYFLRKRGVGYARLDGDTPTMARQKILDACAVDDTIRLLIATTKAGGVGLNMVFANHVLITEPTWTRATVEQAINRIHRIGQTKPVKITLLRTVGTIEEPMFGMMAVKGGLHNYVMDNDAAPPKTFRYSGLSLENIREIITKAKNAATQSIRRPNVRKVFIVPPSSPSPVPVPSPTPAPTAVVTHAPCTGVKRHIIDDDNNNDDDNDDDCNGGGGGSGGAVKRCKIEAADIPI